MVIYFSLGESHYSLLKEARFLAGLPRKHYKSPFCCFPLLHGVKQINMMFPNRVGIIGAHGSELKSLMSKPVGMTEEDEEEEEKEQEQERKDSDFSNLTGGLSLLSLRNPRNRLHSRSTVVSRLMAEADCNQSN